MPSGEAMEPSAATTAVPSNPQELPAPSALELSSESALHANIKAKGAHAYYFAHAKRDTGEEPAPPPVHVPLEVTPVAVTEAVVSITSGYQFIDGHEAVKVYLPFEGIAERLAAAQQEQEQQGGQDGQQQQTFAGVQCEFGVKSLVVNVRGYQAGRTLRFAVKELAGSVEPDKCSHKVLANKVVITLAKSDKTSWSKLTKN